MAEEFLIIGRIVAPHGLRGEVKVRLTNEDDREMLQRLERMYVDEANPRPLEVMGVRFHQRHALVQFKGVTTRSKAEELRGLYVLIPKAWAPPLGEDEYYVHQLLGLRVVTEEGEELGRIVDVLFTGANDVYVIHGGPHGEILIPAIKEVIRAVDLEADEMRVSLMEGLI
ncbi:MAG: ribosome maturation factor RimM [Ardenticatenia bacterium]|nr:ribosome maturation factor RimM [Ardenticatenia bacterium]